MRSMPLPAATLDSSALTARLWPASLLRGVVALVLGVYVLSRPITSPAALARIVCLYWIFDGLTALWASRFAATLATSRAVLMLRGAGGVVAAVVLLNLPLNEAFGPWRPGQIVLIILTMVPVLAAIGLQIILAATVDLLIGWEVRRRIAGEWSIAVGAALSIVVSGLIAAGFLGFSPIPERLFAVVSITGGISLVIGALKLRTAP